MAQLLEADKTLENDVEKAKNVYLNIAENASKKNKEAALQHLIATAERSAGGAVEQLSLAVQNCPLKSWQRTSIEIALGTVRREIIVKREAEIVKICSDLRISFDDLHIDKYYGGGNNKYPPVLNLGVHLCKKDILKEKMMLFDLLQCEREKCCRFAPENIMYGKWVDRCQGVPAIIIPSGGKTGEDLGVFQSMWWYKLIKIAHVVFVVSVDDLIDYVDYAKHDITVVGYDGFGIGCGRAAGMQVAKKLNRICFMTDDRTMSLEGEDPFTNEWMTEKELTLPWICGVGSKYRLNIMTILNPKTRESQKPVFPKNFIASKEDMALSVYCRLLRQRHGTTVKVGGNYGIVDKPDAKDESDVQEKFDPEDVSWENVFIVHTVTNNKNYIPPTALVNYSGRKADTLPCVVESKLYYATGNKQLLNWTYLNKNQGFMNMWDVVKMQESAMYKLLVQIEEEMQENPTAPGMWEAFDKHIAPWF